MLVREHMLDTVLNLPPFSRTAVVWGPGKNVAKHSWSSEVNSSFWEDFGYILSREKVS